MGRRRDAQAGITAAFHLRPPQIAVLNRRATVGVQIGLDRIQVLLSPNLDGQQLPFGECVPKAHSSKSMNIDRDCHPIVTVCCMFIATH